MERPENSKKIDSTSALAAELGLSRWAVSRALNGRTGVSKSTVARIRAALAEHQFEPDPLARALRGGASQTVAVCLPRSMVAHDGSSDSDGTANTILRGLNSLYKHLDENGLRSTIFTSQDSRDESDTLRRACALRPAGVVLICPRLTGVALASIGLANNAVPCVCVAPANELTVTTIRPDLDQATRMTLEHLQQHGHKKIAVFGAQHKSPWRRSFEKIASTSELSERGALRFFHAADLPTTPSTDAGLGWNLADLVIRRRLGATAIVSATDEMALGALARFRQDDRRIPEEFSLVGCGNIPLAAYSNPPLSTIDPQPARLFEQVGHTLCEIMQRGALVETREILVNPLFYKRASTGPAKI